MDSATKYKAYSWSGINALPRFGKESQTIDISSHMPKSGQAALYVHVPFCKSICQFCMLRRGARAAKSVPDAFIESLIKELSCYASNFSGTAITAIYFGGGTASMLSVKQFEEIIEAINRLYKLHSETEITVEGEATSLNNPELLYFLKSSGVKRISFGLQTFDCTLRDLLGRTDTVGELYDLMDNLHKLDFAEVNVDYLYNLPGTDLEFLSKEIDQLKDFAPTSVDCHPLKYGSCSSYMLQKVADMKLSVPNAEMRADMYSYMRSELKSAGFKDQFTDQYSSLELSNSNIYMHHLYGNNGGEYIGFGPGSRSHYGDYGRSNYDNIDLYINNIATGNSPVEKMVSAPMTDNYIACFPKRQGLLSNADISKSGNPEFYFAKLNDLANHGYLDHRSDGYVMTQAGLLWYQNLQEDLLSISQRNNHEETAKKRSVKLMGFEGHYLNLNR